MLYHIVLPVLGLFVLATSVIAEGFGVCYDSYDSANMPAHFRTIKQRFESVRTFQTAMGNQNAITVAANAGLKIAAGVWLLGNRYQEDLDAAIAGAKANPNAVQVIFIGNEELHQGWNAARLTSVVQDAKAKLAAAGVRVPVGIVQTDGDLLANPGLADLVDIVGANIHPFFSGAPDSTTDPIKDLKRRYEAVVAKFGSKVRVTEVGWPSQGGSFQGHTASAALSEKFYYDVKGWQQSTGTAAYYFMYHDNLGKGGFESYFGIAHPNGQWKFGGTPVYPPTDAPTTKPPAPTTNPPAPTTNPPVPTTNPPAPTTNPPAPTTNPPAPTTNPPAPTTYPPAPTTKTPSPTTKAPAPTTEAPAPTTNPPAPTTAAPAPTTNPPATYSPTSPPTTASPTTTLAPVTTSPSPTTLTPTTTAPLTTTAPTTTSRPVTTSPSPTTLAPTTTAPLSTTAPTTTSRPVTPIVTNHTSNNSTNNSTNSSDITFPPLNDNSTASINASNSITFNSTAATDQDINSAGTNQENNSAVTNQENNSAGTSPSQGQLEGNRVNGDSKPYNDVNVQATNSANGVDVGAISGVAIGGFAAAAIAVIAVVRHRRAQAIQLENERKSDAELAMLSRRSAIMML